MLQFERLLYVPEIIRFKVISHHHNDLLAEHLGIDKTRELVGRKYYWLSLKKDIEAYIRGCDICLTSKVVRHKPYGDLQSLPILTHRWKNLFMDFVIRLLLSSDWKNNSYNSILVIVKQLTKMVQYKSIEVTINTLGLAEVIIDMVVWHHGLSDSIISNQRAIFTSKFWFSLCYLLGIKRQLSIAFHPQTDGQTKQQNSTMEAYLCAFVNWKQNYWARLLPMAEFIYNNSKNTSTGHMPFKLYYGYYPRILYKEKVNPHSKFKSADELSEELRKLMIVYCENFYYTQDLQKWAYDKEVKPRSYASGKKVWLNGKFIKTKRNQKLKANFFGPFWVLHPIEK